MKTVAFKMPAPAVNAEEWVKGAELPKERVPMKRFTIDVPRDLHLRVKIECAKRGVQMCDVIRELLEQEFPKD
jgi:hypothetical protein